MSPAADEYFINAALHGADAGSFSISKIRSTPTRKDAARVLVRDALRAVDFLRCERMRRINQVLLD